MKVVWASECKRTTVGDSNLIGRLLYGEEDGIPGYFYEVRGEKGKHMVLKAAHGEGYTHAYYFLEGHAEGRIKDEKFDISEDTVLALDSKTKVVIEFSENTKFLAVFTRINDDINPAESCLVRKLEGITNTERDVNWGRGRSRRFLLKSDGYNVGLHSTLCHPNNSSPLHYVNNLEICYYYKGKGRYIWDQGNTEMSYDFTADSPQKGDAMVLLIEYDQHYLEVYDAEACNICTFYPPLLGHERHNFDKKGFSVYAS